MTSRDSCHDPAAPLSGQLQFESLTDDAKATVERADEDVAARLDEIRKRLIQRGGLGR